MKTFDFVGNRKKFYILSSALILIVILFSFIFGVQLDIQFKGGTILEYTYSGDIDTSKVDSITEETTGMGASIQTANNTLTGQTTLVITLPTSNGLSAESQNAITDALKQEFPDNSVEVLEISNVDAAIGREFLMKCLVAVAAAFVLIIIYIALRFRKIGGLSAGVMGVLALLHDALMVFGVFVIFRIPLDDNFIAVVLMILGYSINDTIVIYDRIRENKRLLGPKASIAELVNISINQSLTRSLNTSIATIIALSTICVVTIVCGVSSIVSFAFPMLVGMISGVYSTIFIAGPLWVTWLEYKEKKAQQNKNSGKGKKK
ncbi:MAG TPA: protein translocase subunit SecF [Firmicutes bacterium]|nr:protein translocase subunit SecF [Bacillota bacterium]